MPSFRTFLTCLALSLPIAGSLAAQTPKAQLPSGKAAEQPRAPKPPALIDPAGPAVSLESSEAMFDVAVALNTCGYDAGLAQSDPVRRQVRDAVNRAAQASPEAQEARDQLCGFINQHRLSEGSRDLAQYVSLALYLTPPPELAPSVEHEDLPPDATQVMDMLPTLRKFAAATQLHLIWVRFHPAYEEEAGKLHDPLTAMTLATNTYLKLPTSTYSGTRFLVVLEPMLDPGLTNARVYGSDYVVVASPVNGTLHSHSGDRTEGSTPVSAAGNDLHDVRHTYLHYEIEPLLYARANSLDRLLPLLKTVRDAPLEYQYRADIVSLTIECLIRAVEARTMDTGVAIFNLPANAPRIDVPRLQHEHDVSVQQGEAVRQKVVHTAMTEGFVLTQYFYAQLGSFERSPESLKEAMGPMVYGMDVDQQVHQARQIAFVEQAPSDVIRNPVSGRGLDQAESRLKAGDAEGASKLALAAIKDHTADPARANYLLGLTWLMKGDMDSAANDFRETIRLTEDPRLLAWSHIYLGRIDDVEEARPDALNEYRIAMTVRDGQQDTLDAAKRGIDQPFALPRAAALDRAKPQ